MALATIDSCLGQIDDLVRRAADYGDMEFRLRLEELVKKGGRDTENAIAHYITGTYIGIPTRLNLVRMAGYILSPAFLLPLQKVIDMGEDNLLREEAIVSISKYNDRRALDILISALEKIRNPLLQEAIARSISRIKNEQPAPGHAAPLPARQPNRELFQITLKIYQKDPQPRRRQELHLLPAAWRPAGGRGVFRDPLLSRQRGGVFFRGRVFPGAQPPAGAGRREQGRRRKAGDADRRPARVCEALPDFFPQLRPDIVALQGLARGCDWGKSLAALLADLEKGSGASG